MSEDYLPAGNQEQEEVKAPFSFKLMIVLTVLYLGWRLIQGIVWLVERLT
ncbi:MAG TPA: hypothetical protein VLA91_14680 [Acidimicrobiia bacterium]|jgi:hypothetical protein|nr:hypothetical protein [Acidimicrobiia bacterium]